MLLCLLTVLDEDETELFDAAIEIFNNSEGLPDGSALYGIILKSAGVGVDWFGAGTTQYSSNAVIENVKIRDLKLKVNEIIAYYNQAGQQVTGTFCLLSLGLFACIMSHNI